MLTSEDKQKNGGLIGKQHFVPYSLNFICVTTRLPKCTAIVKPTTRNASLATKKFYHLPNSHTADSTQHNNVDYYIVRD